MSLVDQIDSDLNQALKSADKAKLSTLRLLKNSLTAAAKDKKSDLDDTEAVKIIQKEVKQRHDSVASFKQGGRGELAAREEAEIKVLEQYLPAQLGESELAELVKQTIEQIGAASATDIGKVMGQLNQKLAGKADMGLVAKLAKEQLTGK